MRSKVLLPLAIAAVVVLVGVAAHSLAFASTERADCQGTVICPLTDKEVCKDQCPLVGTQRVDCPGKIECPLTGELVCRDKCPLADTLDGTVAPKPRCCQGSK